MQTCLCGFDGEYATPLSGVYLAGNGYRAYDPALMRFTSPDSESPFRAGGINAYAFCGGDPLNRADPSGHAAWPGGVGIAFSLLGILLIPFTAGQSMAVTAVLMGSALVSTGLAVASDGLEHDHPRLATSLRWAALLTALPEVACGAVKGLQALTAGLRSWQRFIGKIQRVNGALGIPMSGQFRNARLLGIDQTQAIVRWNLSYEDLVPTGTRLNIIMGSQQDNLVFRAANEVWWDSQWTRLTYSATQLKNAARMAGDYAIYRLIIPGSATRYGASRVFAGNISRFFPTIPVIGYRQVPQAYGPVAEALQLQYDLTTQLRARNILPEQHAIQDVLNELSQRYAMTPDALTFDAGQASVYPHTTLNQHPDLFAW